MSDQIVEKLSSAILAALLQNSEMRGDVVKIREELLAADTAYRTLRRSLDLVQEGEILLKATLERRDARITQLHDALLTSQDNLGDKAEVLSKANKQIKTLNQLLVEGIELFSEIPAEDFPDSMVTVYKAYAERVEATL